MAWLRTYWQDQYLPRLRLHFGDKLEVGKCILLVSLITAFCILAINLVGAA